MTENISTSFGNTRNQKAHHAVLWVAGFRHVCRLAGAAALLVAAASVMAFGVPRSEPFLLGGGALQTGQSGSQQESSSRTLGRNTGHASPASVADGGAVVSSGDDYRIGPADVIELHVEDAPELSRTFTVGADGTFLMPYLHRISALQKTPQQLEKLIVDGLRGKYLVDPHVTVTVTGFNSRSYFIEGAVHSPGLYIVKGNPSLMKLITIAGGLADNHGSTAFIIRQLNDGRQVETPNPEQIPDKAATNSGQIGASVARQNTAEQAPEDRPKYQLIKANINGLFRGEFDQDKTVEPGDIINIPPTDIFFVAGEVKRAGSFPLKEGTTLRQAISMAEGTTFKAAVHRAVIFRDNPKTGKREEINVDVGKVMAGKEEDVPILANDIIEIPNSRSRTAFGALLTGLGATALRAPIP